jgi:hypothetical protein
MRVCAVLFCAATVVEAADRVDPLARARQLYNLGDYEAAVVAADEGGRTPEKADGAHLVAARAYLEKFRRSSSPDDLVSARGRLSRINTDHLTAAERVEWVVGLGEALYFDGAAGAAGELFDSVLDDASLEEDARDVVLDWWASALDEEARKRPDSDRSPVYDRIRRRMRIELSRDPASATASYWVSAAARGEGDLQTAWDAAQAGWVRSALSGDRGKALRDDLNRLVIRALVPERARALGYSEDYVLSEWTLFKERWQK